MDVPDIFVKVLTILIRLILALLFWKPLGWPLRQLKKIGFLQPYLCKEELRRGGYPDSNNAPAFIDCAEQGRLDKVELFIQTGIDADIRADGGDTALIAAARQGRGQIVRYLLEQPSINVNAKNKVGDTALIVAARAGRSEAVRALLASGKIDPNLRNDDDESAWIAAIRAGASEIESLLEDRRADDRGVNKWRLRVAFENQGRFNADELVGCCAQGRTSDVRDFLTAGMDVNARNQQGEPALVAAARRGDPELIELLLAQEFVDVNARSGNGDFSLIVASREGRIQAVECLLQHDEIEVNLSGAGGDTALIVGARLGHEMIVRALLDQPAVDVKARNQAKEDALLEAARREFEPIVTLLVEHGSGSKAAIVTRIEEPAASPSKAAAYLDENVQFTVYRPNVVHPAQWCPMLAFAHLTQLRPGQPGPTPLEQVEQEARLILARSTTEYVSVAQDSIAPVPRGDELTFVPNIAGVEFNPPRQSFRWIEDVHRVEFRFRASTALDGQVARGRMTVFLGSIVLADIALGIRVDSSHSGQVKAETTESMARPYRKIFASYSHKDLAIVEQIERYARSLGDRYLRDSTELRAGEVWSESLERMIEKADVFQLFWSWNSMASPYVRKEWEHALKLRRENFVRPTYWDEPLPKSPDGELPPAELLRLQFERIPLKHIEEPDVGSTVEQRIEQENLEREVAHWQLNRKGLFTAAELLGSTLAQDFDRLRKLLVAGMPPDEARDADQNTPLLLAARKPDDRLVPLLLGYGADVRARNQFGDTALILAARDGLEANVKFLLESGAEVQARNNNHESALLEAKRRNFGGIVALLDAKGSNEPDLEAKAARWQLERAGVWNESQFVRAAELGDERKVEQYLLAGMNVNAADERLETGLIAAIRNESVKIRTGLVKRLLQHPEIDVNLSGAGGDTALIVAARQGHEDIVRVLLDQLAVDVNARNDVRESALLEAAKREFAPIVTLLIEHGAGSKENLEREVAHWQLNRKGLFTAAELLGSTLAQDFDRLRKLLVAGMPPDEARDADQNTPLLLAALKPDERLVPLLLGYGADVRARNQFGDTALILAARDGLEANVKFLLESGAEVQARNNNHESALLEAKRRNFGGIVALLDAKGANEPDLEARAARWQLERQGVWNESQFVRAAGLGDERMVEQYLLAGMSVNAADERLETGLIAAARGKRVEMLRLLLGRPDIDFEARNREGSSAVEIAASHGYKSQGYKEIVALLTAAGAELDPRALARRRIREAALPYTPEELIRQAASGQEENVSLFLAAGMHANAADDRGRKALIEAARAGQKSVVELLLKSGADPNLRDCSGISAREAAERAGYSDVADLLRVAGGEPTEPLKDRLLDAIERGDLTEVRAALAAGASPNSFTDQGRPVLMEAVLGERPDIVSELLAKGARADARDRDSMTSLMRTAELGRVEMMRLLLANEGAGLNEADTLGRTVLILAAWHGRVAAVKILTEAGADPGIRDGKGRTALIAARNKGHTEIVEILQEMGAAEESGQAHLLEAVALGDDARVAELVGQGAAVDVEASDEAGNTPLALAAARGWTRSMELLIAAGALRDAANEEGDTPLMQAARAGRRAAVEILLRQDAGRALANATNIRGETALFQAAVAGRGPAVELLASYSDDPDLGTGGRTALVEMCYQGESKAVAALIDAGADVNQPGVTLGKSPLMTAILAGQLEVVETLKASGAWAGEIEARLFLMAKGGDDEGLGQISFEGVDLKARDRNGWTALMAAAAEGHDGVVKILLDAGADADLKVPDGPETALRLAASKGRTGALALLIGKTRRSESSDTGALIEAATGGHAEAVRLLVKEAGAQVNGLKGRRIPLVEAARKGHLQAVKVLLELGADPERKTRHGMTAVMTALLHKHDDVADLLLQSGSKAGLKEVRLLMAAGKPDLAEVERLLAPPEPADLAVRDEAGRTPLMLACEKGAAVVVDVLLQHYGAEKASRAVLEQDSSGNTPLMWAATGRSPAIVSRLLNLNPNIVDAESNKNRTALMEACKSGSYRSVQILLDALKGDPERRVAVNQQDKDGNSPLSEALLGASPLRQNEYAQIVVLLVRWEAEQGRKQAEFLIAVQSCKLETVQRLIGEVDFKKLRRQGKTPLMLAAEFGCREVAEYLLKKGADAEERGPGGVTALMLAARENRKAILGLLLDWGADFDITDDFESSALLEAIKSKHEGIVEDLVNTGANVNQKDHSGATALALAIEGGKARIVKLLLGGKRKLNLEVWSGERRTALTLAHLHGSMSGFTKNSLPALGVPLPAPLTGKLTQIETLLLEAGARAGWDEAELILAIRAGELVWALSVMARASVHTRDLDGSPPLLLACARGDLSLARALLARRAIAEVRNDAGRTPLIEAAKSGSRPLVEELLQKAPDLDINAQDRVGDGALLEAARAGAADVVTLLLDRGANVRVANHSGDTALIQMARHQHPQAVRALLAKGANACAHTNRNRTAIIEAAAHGHIKNLEVLIEDLETRLARQTEKRKAIINAVDKQSRTALDWADQGGHANCAALLREHGGVSVVDTDDVIFTTPQGHCYHRYDCRAISIARENKELTQHLLLDALREQYEFCLACRPGQAKIDWTC